MPLQIVRNDITQMKVDAIVNAANESLLGGGGVDGAIHHAAGPELLAECETLGGCKPGNAKVTGAYHLPCKYVIHTVGPIWHGGQDGEQEVLVSCYQSSLALALEKECETVAFPLISSGIYGYPKDQALRVAVDTISAFLAAHEMMVYIVVYDPASYQVGGQLFADIKAYIDDHYIEEHPERMNNYHRGSRDPRLRREFLRRYGYIPDEDVDTCAVNAAPPEANETALYRGVPAEAPAKSVQIGSLEEALANMDKGFMYRLMDLIRESGMSEVECYKKANIGRKLWSKMCNTPNYRPSKRTAVAFALALHLSIEDTQDLLQRAGLVLSDTSKFDVIIKYCIQNGEYDVFKINETLFAFDQELLGC